MSRTFTSLFLAATTLIAVSCATPRTHPDNRSLELVWEENFDGTNFNPLHWSKVGRGGSDWNRKMAPHDELFEVKDGILNLYGIKNTRYPEDSSKYITGGLLSKGKVTFTYGRVDIRAKFNDVVGAWPALWLLPDEYGWPKGGEIDICERLNHDSIAYQTVHSELTVNKLGGKDAPPQGSTNRINSNDFNIYSVEWTPDSLRFFVNSCHTFTYPRLSNYNPEKQYPWNSPFYFILSQQLEGSWVGNIMDENELPAVMQVDWIKIYQDPKQAGNTLYIKEE